MKKLSEQERDCKYYVDNGSNTTYRYKKDAKKKAEEISQKTGNMPEIIDQYPGQY